MRRKCHLTVPIAMFFMLLIILNLRAYGQGFDRIRAQVKEHTLSNGMKFIILERHEAPVVSFHVYADVGAANESYGITGISHLLEHMAFKGTTTVGTKDYEAEKSVLSQMDELYDKIHLEKNKTDPDTVLLAEMNTTFEKLRLDAKEYVINNEFIDMLTQQGDTGINAYTSPDATQYTNSLPSNKLEFWMAMVSDRFMNPVFREFYKEKDVVMEERRLSIETQPIGKLYEDFFATAFKAHPYHHLVLGHMSVLEQITRKDVEDYFQSYYSPGNLTVGIVGDVDADAVFKMAELYFGRIPSESAPEQIRTVEPEQWGERRVEVVAKSQPILLIGYHRPSIRHEDDAALEALSVIIGKGRSSRLYKKLVKDTRVAAQCNTIDLKGVVGKYPSLFILLAVPSKDHTVEECLEFIDEEIGRIIEESATDQELTKFKRNWKKTFINQMKSNGSMAELLTNADVLLGDWNLLFEEISKVESVTIADVQRVANEYLTRSNRTIGEIIPEESN